MRQTQAQEENRAGGWAVRTTGDSAGVKRKIITVVLESEDANYCVVRIVNKQPISFAFLILKWKVKLPTVPSVLLEEAIF